MEGLPVASLVDVRWASAHPTGWAASYRRLFTPGKVSRPQCGTTPMFHSTTEPRYYPFFPNCLTISSRQSNFDASISRLPLSSLKTIVHSNARAPVLSLNFLSSTSWTSRTELAPRDELHVRSQCELCGFHCLGWNFVCNKCGSLMKIDTTSPGWNYFAVFNQSPRYDLSRFELDLAYKRLQSLVHPDKFAMSTQEQQKRAGQHSAFITRAYNALANPVSRATHLMEEVYGVKVFGDGDADAADAEEEPEFAGGGPGRVRNQELLMDILEAHDRIDAAKSIEDIKVIQQQCSAITGEALKTLSAAIAQKDWLRARGQIEIVQMYRRVQHRLKYWEFGDAHSEMIGQA